MVRNTTSAGTVAGTGLIRTPSGERGATHSGDERKSSFRLNVGLNSPAGQPIPWSAVDPYLRSTPPIQVKQQNELGRAFNGHLADHHRFLLAHMFGRIDSIDADIVEQIDAHLALFMWNAILDTRVLIAEKLGAAPLSGPDHCTTPTRVGHRDTCVCPPLPKDRDHDEEV